MQILVAYAVSGDAGSTGPLCGTVSGVGTAWGETRGAERQRRVAEGVERVSALPRWVEEPVLRQQHAARAGVMLWEAQETPSRWPSWVCGGDGSTVASLYAPLGHRQVTGDAPLDIAPVVLADALCADPGAMGRLTPPFVLVRLDASGRLDLFTDALGMGRLFELVTPWGRVWSNRGDAALRFAGWPARASAVGWTHAAVADEFFGEASPYEGVRALDAATHVCADADGRLSVRAEDVVAQWAAEARTDPDTQARLVARAAQDLRAAAASVGELYAEIPTVDLSGGRDSRVVAAAFLTSGTPMRLHSHDAFAPDLATALELVDMLRRREPGTEAVHAARDLDEVEHRTRHVATGGAVQPRPLAALDAARRWHAYGDGLRPCTFIAHAVPEGLDLVNSVVVGGVGGELAHSVYYPARYAELDELPPGERLDRYAANVLARVAPVAGATADSRATVLAHVRQRFEEIHLRGFAGARALDVFYARERMRRWGTTAERLGVVSPLLSPAFTAAALALTPEQRTRGELHRNIVRELIPAWADVPFFAAEKHLLTDPEQAIRTAAVRSQGEAAARAARRVRARLDARVTAGAPVAAGAVPPAGGGPAGGQPCADENTPPATPPVSRVLRLADSTDADAIADVIAAGAAGPAAWAEVLDVATVQRYWHESVAGTTTVRQERVLRQVVWRTGFEDHVADLDGRERPSYPTRSPETAATAARGLGVLPPTTPTPSAANATTDGTPVAPVSGAGRAHSPATPAAAAATARPRTAAVRRRLVTGVRRNRAVRALARSALWRRGRDTRLGRAVRVRLRART